MEYEISEWIVVTTLLTHYIAAIIKALSLLGSPRDGQAALFLFQKHLVSWKCGSALIASIIADVFENRY
jgi:hypothetical protein